MKVRYTDSALAEIDAILSHIAEDNPLAAEEVAAVLQATIARLSEYPRLAIQTDGIGRARDPRTPYRYLNLLQLKS